MRGMTVRDIEQATSIGHATFMRWRTLAGGLPKVDKVQAFAAGLDVPLQPALDAMGLSSNAPAAPEPELDPDLRPIARRLADPNVSDDEKTAIRNMLRLISRQTVSPDSTRRAVS
jgi:hypothetical protein